MTCGILTYKIRPKHVPRALATMDFALLARAIVTPLTDVTSVADAVRVRLVARTPTRKLASATRIESF